MIISGSVVVAAGRLGRVVLIEGTDADVVYVDHAGRIVRKVHSIYSLKPFRAAMQPRSFWPDSHEGGDEVRTRAPNKVKASRKPRLSKKAKKH